MSTENENKEIYMEDVININIKVNDTLEQQLKKYGKTLTNEQSNEIHDALEALLDKVFVCPDYRHHH